VLAYAGLDFGFFQRIFPLTPAIERIYRAGAEVVLAATLLVFLFAYLNLVDAGMCATATSPSSGSSASPGLIGLAVFDAPMASGIARISIAAVAAVGFVLILHLATHGYERAVMLIPTWFLLAVWVTAAGFTVTGQFQRDLVAPALLGGLVLIVLLIGFTVIQHAFAGGAVSQGLVSDTERRALASRAPAISSSTGMSPPTRSSSRRRSRRCSACRAARSKARPRAGSSTCMSPIATATASRSTPCWSSAAASSISISACARPMAPITGSTSRRGR
jgi:hypothetical protein